MAEAESSFDPSRNYDDESMTLQREIEKEIAQNQNMIGPAQPIDELVENYAKEDQIYRRKLEDLKKRYSHIRRVRGDGNCFFRGFGFAYLESLISDPDEFKRFMNLADKSKDDLLALGFPQFTIEDFYETFMEVSRKPGSEDFGVEDLADIFNNQSFSDYYVVYLRLLVSGHLQKEADFYTNFMEGDRSAKEFCSQEVEPMGRESDHIHIIALSSALGICVLVEYMERGGDDVCNQVVVPEGGQPNVRLLYRPGHYDILYINQ